MKILILTVGGSYKPLLKAIEQTKPDFIHFLCSNDGAQQPGSYRQIIGEGNVLHSNLPKENPPPPDLPNLARLAKLDPSKFSVHKIDQPDNLDACFEKASEIITATAKQTPQAEILVDYTGGTKSMTAGLASAALDHGECKFQLVAGRRDDLRQVRDGTEFVRSMRVDDVHTRRALLQCHTLLQRYDYIGAVRVMEQATAAHYSEKFQQEVQRILDLARAFDAWDRFEHQQAKLQLQTYKSEFKSYYTHLSLELSGQGHGWELVEDLLLNAKRRAAQERYDDAAGRLYRALELTIQVWLNKRYNIDTGNIDLSLVPESAHERLRAAIGRNGRIQAGLWQAWNLLADFPKDPLSQVFESHRDEFLKHINVRNLSLFAHGTKPITRHEFESFAAFCDALLFNCINIAISSLGLKRLSPPLQQFPTSF